MNTMELQKHVQQNTHDELEIGKSFHRDGVDFFVGDYVEVEADAEADADRPWMARIVGLREVETSAGGVVEEVNCEWLWHPADTAQEYPGVISPIDLSRSFGKFEVFKGANLSDWNAAESMRRKITLLPYEEYTQLPRYPNNDDPVQRGRACVWFYRQTFDAEVGVLSPQLPLSVALPNAEYYRYCDEHRVDGNELRVRLPGSSVFSSRLQDAPPPYIPVIENPDKRYYFCTFCQWLFESPYGLNGQLDNGWELRASPSTPPDIIVCPDCAKLNPSEAPIDPLTLLTEQRQRLQQQVQRLMLVAASAPIDGSTHLPPGNSDISVTTEMLGCERKRDFLSGVNEEPYNSKKARGSIDDPLDNEVQVGLETSRESHNRLLGFEHHQSKYSESLLFGDSGSSSQYSERPALSSGIQTRHMKAVASASAANHASHHGASNHLDDLFNNGDVAETPNWEKEPSSARESSVPTDGDEAKRKLVKIEKFTEVLAKGVNELKASGRESEIVDIDVAELAREIVEAFDMYCLKNSIVGRSAHQHMHERFQNMKRANNTDLRRRLLTGALSADEFASCDAKELAPEFLRRKRQQEANRYFQQQVLLPSGPSKLIRKTHKGLEEVAEDTDGQTAESQLAPLTGGVNNFGNAFGAHYKTLAHFGVDEGVEGLHGGDGRRRRRRKRVNAADNPVSDDGGPAAPRKRRKQKLADAGSSSSANSRSEDDCLDMGDGSSSGDENSFAGSASSGSFASSDDMDGFYRGGGGGGRGAPLSSSSVDATVTMPLTNSTSSVVVRSAVVGPLSFEVDNSLVPLSLRRQLKASVDLSFLSRQFIVSRFKDRLKSLLSEEDSNKLIAQLTRHVA